MVNAGNHSRPGFTLAELLVVLTVLSIISTFSVSKLLISTQFHQYKAMAKEFAGNLSEAYQKATLETTLNASTTLQTIMKHMNYVSVQTTGNLDDSPGWAYMDCNWDGGQCMTLQNGAKLYYKPLMEFGGTGENNGMWVMIDPDAKADGYIKAATFFVTFKGRVLEVSDIQGPGISSNQDCWGGACYYVATPDWFKWQ
jgi:prepilin-type N-terminal cleavage/methylation domain-containing protein